MPREYMREMCGIDGAACDQPGRGSCETPTECHIIERIRATQRTGQKLAQDIQRGVYKQ